MCDHARLVLFDLNDDPARILTQTSPECYEKQYFVPVANATVFYSEVGEELLKRHPASPFAGYYMDRGDGQRQWGLRSRPSFDCSVIAKALGGGGHKQASGFVQDLRADMFLVRPEPGQPSVIQELDLDQSENHHRQFDFHGKDLDLNQWRVANAQQDEKLILEGQGSWGSAWAFPLDLKVKRGGWLEGRVDTPTGTTHAMVGFRRPSLASGNYAQLVYAVYFANGDLRVYENGTDRGKVATYTRGLSYDFRIETQPGSGARYYLRQSGTGAAFAKVLETTNYSDTTFGCCFDVHSGVFCFDDLAVGDVYFEGRDVASVPITSVTGAPPVAVITASTLTPEGTQPVRG
jgi:hypothetical protein